MLKQLRLLIDIINSLGGSSTIQNSKAFYDEPPVNFFSGLIHFPYKNRVRGKGYEVYTQDIVAGGSSFENKELGILKCAAELIERICLFTFHPNSIIFKTLSQMKGNIYVDPKEINGDAKNDGTYGWVKGVDLTDDSTVFVPAQMVYLNYFAWAKKTHGESQFIQHISNGGCFGFSKESTIIRGIYELIERDSILTKFLGKVPMPIINTGLITDSGVKEFRALMQEYQFLNLVFDATNDLGVPTYFSATIDTSSVVPFATFGAKTSSNKIEAIKGAMEESLMGRTWVRYELLNRKGTIPKINPEKIVTRLDRAFYFADKRNVENLYFLKTPVHSEENFFTVPMKKISDRQELSSIVSAMKKKNIRVIVVDIKPAFLKDYPIHIYKVIIPDLQYLYLEEPGKIINKKRVEDVRSFFAIQKNLKLETAPHFLL